MKFCVSCGEIGSKLESVIKRVVRGVGTHGCRPRKPKEVSGTAGDLLCWQRYSPTLPNQLGLLQIHSTVR